MSGGKLIESKVITDFRQPVVCVLPISFYFDDERWGRIWQRFEGKGDSLSMANLKALFLMKTQSCRPAMKQEKPLIVAGSNKSLFATG